MTYDCIILGGGISGLGAGKTLIQKGITNFLILEGRERIGGRIHSQDMQGGFYAELGAERIGKTHKNLIKIIKGNEMKGNEMKGNEMKGNEMKLIDHTFGFHSHLHVSNVSGVTKSVYHMHEEKLNNFLNSFHSRKDEKIKKYDNYTLEALLIELGIDIMGLEDLELENSNEFGETMKMLSASRFIINCLTGGGNCHCDYKIEQGNSKIIDKLISFIGKEKISTNANYEIRNTR